MRQDRNHGKEHLDEGSDPTFHPKHLIIKMSADNHTPFTVAGTDPYTDGYLAINMPPDMDGWYLTDAQASVSEASASGDILVDMLNDTQAFYVLGDGAASASLPIAESARIGSLASTGDVLTTMQFAGGDLVLIYVTQTDGAARGLEVWLKFGKHPAPGANAPTAA